jgi:hypothetical protein
MYRIVRGKRSGSQQHGSEGASSTSFLVKCMIFHVLDF